MEEAQPRHRLNRSAIEAWVGQHIAAWEARDAPAISVMLQPTANFMLPAFQRQGQASIQAALSEQLAGWQTLRIHIRRLLVDVDQQVAAVEWIGRGIKDSACEEILGGTVLDFDSNSLVRRWRTYLDPVRRRSLPRLDAPLPNEGWSPSTNPGPPLSRTAVEQFIRTYGQTWSSHDVSQISSFVHDEIVLQPPWDYAAGRTTFEAGVRVYFANYADTQVTPHRLILDPSQPHFGVCEQTFACTNPDTGQRGEDHDFAFFELAQGKLRYWRTYFDTSRSAQVVEKTIGYLQGTAQA